MEKFHGNYVGRTVMIEVNKYKFCKDRPILICLLGSSDQIRPIENWWGGKVEEARGRWKNTSQNSSKTIRRGGRM